MNDVLGCGHLFRSCSVPLGVEISTMGSFTALLVKRTACKTGDDNSSQHRSRISVKT